MQCTSTITEFLPPAMKSGQGYVYTHICDSVHMRGGCLGPGPGGRLEGLAGEGGLQAHTRGVQAHTKGESPGPHPGGSPGPGLGGVSQHALRQTPPASKQLLLWAVRILLECILVHLILSDLAILCRLES